MSFLGLAMFLVSFNIHTFLWDNQLSKQSFYKVTPIYQYILPTCGPSAFVASYQAIKKRKFSYSKAMSELMGRAQNGTHYRAMSEVCKKSGLDTKSVLVRVGRVNQVIKKMLDEKRLVMPIVNSEGNPISEGTHWLIIYGYTDREFLVACSNDGYKKIEFNDFRFRWAYPSPSIRNNCMIVGVK